MYKYSQGIKVYLKKWIALKILHLKKMLDKSSLIAGYLENKVYVSNQTLNNNIAKPNREFCYDSTKINKDSKEIIDKNFINYLLFKLDILCKSF